MDPVVDDEAPEAEIDGEVVWVDEAPAGATTDPVDAGMEEIEQQAAQKVRSTPVGQGQQRQRQRPSPREPRAQRSGPPAEVVVATVPLLTRLGDWARRQRNVILFVAVGLLIAATVASRLWRQQRQDLPRIAALGRVDGLAALDEGDFDNAYQLLTRARDAVEALGDAVEGAAQIRQGAAEAELFVRLVPQRLEVILDEAARDDPKEWPSHFAASYKGRSIVVDTHVVAVPDPSGHGRYELDYQILPDGLGDPRRTARLDTTGLRLFIGTKPKVGDRVTFGARLAEFTYDSDAREWRVGLEPESGVFLTHPKALQALGWPSLADPPAREGDGP
jgi:hypothetical protein